MDISIGLWVIIIIGGLSGIISSLYIVVSLLGTLGYKIYRKFRFGLSLYD